ncbi:D-tyrosyl-tRNA(Tyr) deacylase [Pseudonocardia ammonioxydans]|uniref:D-tyrosyl-tRNA(Tyr) deacylase n=1 Tax=Pseudonocardia ammonioxydans TaxID=260086 RepID=A0A1I4VLB0_PSUAM|nr:D-aminoacyl-tRNA deacylase [Pseudonocardia ammonioxydans]SFN02052.1 D-tyrosyl-tRNA(Tyr) deacylase [Pseudonocardia ammonioxydans]
MRAVVARVRRASVTIVDEHDEPLRVSGAIGPGLLVLLGVHRDDVPGPGATGDASDPPGPTAGAEVDARADAKAETMARKLHELRLLRDERSCADSGAPLLVVSQFTLYGETRKGRRPSWSGAARPEDAAPVVEAVVAALRARGATVETGEFGAAMAVESVNDGPFTVLVEV